MRIILRCFRNWIKFRFSFTIINSKRLMTRILKILVVVRNNSFSKIKNRNLADPSLLQSLNNTTNKAKNSKIRLERIVRIVRNQQKTILSKNNYFKIELYKVKDLANKNPGKAIEKSRQLHQSNKIVKNGLKISSFRNQSSVLQQINYNSLAVALKQPTTNFMINLKAKEKF